MRLTENGYHLPPTVLAVQEGQPLYYLKLLAGSRLESDSDTGDASTVPENWERVTDLVDSGWSQLIVSRDTIDCGSCRRALKRMSRVREAIMPHSDTNRVIGSATKVIQH